MFPPDVRTPSLAHRDIREVITTMRTPRMAIFLPEAIPTDSWVVALERGCAGWGSLHSTIFVPIDQWAPGTAWDRFLAHFDADYIAVHQDIVPEEELTAWYGPFSVSSDPVVLEGGEGPWPFTAMTHIVEVLSNRAAQVDVPFQLENYEFEDMPGYLRLVFGREIGRFDPQTWWQLRARTALFRSEPTTVQLSSAQALAYLSTGAFARPYCPASRNFEALESLSGPGEELGPILVLGSTTADICLWLTLRTLCASIPPAPVAWWPADLLGVEESNYGPGLRVHYVHYGSACVEILKRRDAPDPIVSLVSASLGMDQLREARTLLIESLPDFPDSRCEPDASRLLTMRHHPAIQDTLTSELQEIVDGLTHRFVSMQYPAWMRHVTEPDVGFVADCEVQHVWTPPNPSVLPLVSSNWPIRERAGHYNSVLEFAWPGASAGIETPARVPPFRAQVPDIDTILQRYVAPLNGYITVSSAGQKVRTLVRMLGGLERAARDLQSGPLQKLLDEFLQPMPQRRGKILLSHDRRIYLRPEAIADALQVDEQDAVTARLLDALVKRGIFHYGFVLRCPHCSLSKFYAFDELSADSVRCEQCRQVFAATPHTACGWKPALALNGLVYSAMAQHAHEEIALAAWLATHSVASALAIGVEWTVGKLKVETDVAGVVDGQLCLGEAKSSRSIGKEAAQKSSQEEDLAELAALLFARRLVFATSQDRWQPESHARLASLQPLLPGAQIEVYAGLLQEGGPTPVEAETIQ